MVKDKILDLFNSANEQKQKQMANLSRLWRIGEGLVILKKLLGDSNYKLWSGTSDANLVVVRNILQTASCLTDDEKDLWMEKVFFFYFTNNIKV